MLLKNLTSAEVARVIHSHNYDQPTHHRVEFREYFPYAKLNSLHNIRIRNLDHPEQIPIISLYLGDLLVYIGDNLPAFTLEEPLLGSCASFMHFYISNNNDLHLIEYDERTIDENDLPPDLIDVYYQIDGKQYCFGTITNEVNEYHPYKEVDVDDYLDERSRVSVQVPSYYDTIIHGDEELLTALRRCHLIHHDYFMQNGVEDYGPYAWDELYISLTIAEENLEAYRQFARHHGCEIDYMPHYEEQISLPKRQENEIKLNRLLDLYNLRQ